MNYFEKAADVLRKQGWIRGALHSERGYCLVGAMNYAYYGEANVSSSKVFQRDYQRVWRLLQNEIAHLLRSQNVPIGSSDIAIPSWNDHVATKEQVFEVLAKASAKYEAAHAPKIPLTKSEPEKVEIEPIKIPQPESELVPV